MTDAFAAKEPKPSPEVAGKAYRYASELLDVLEGAIGNHEFLAGDAPTIADFTNFSIFQTARERFNQPFGEEHPRLDAWYRNFRGRPSAEY